MFWKQSPPRSYSLTIPDRNIWGWVIDGVCGVSVLADRDLRPGRTYVTGSRSFGPGPPRSLDVKYFMPVPDPDWTFDTTRPYLISCYCKTIELTGNYVRGISYRNIVAIFWLLQDLALKYERRNAELDPLSSYQHIWLLGCTSGRFFSADLLQGEPKCPMKSRVVWDFPKIITISQRGSSLHCRETPGIPVRRCSVRQEIFSSNTMLPISVVFVTQQKNRILTMFGPHRVNFHANPPLTCPYLLQHPLAMIYYPVYQWIFYYLLLCSMSWHNFGHINASCYWNIDTEPFFIPRPSKKTKQN